MTHASTVAMRGTMTRFFVTVIMFTTRVGLAQETIGPRSILRRRQRGEDAIQTTLLENVELAALSPD